MDCQLSGSVCVNGITSAGKKTASVRVFNESGISFSRSSCGRGRHDFGRTQHCPDVIPRSYEPRADPQSGFVIVVDSDHGISQTCARFSDCLSELDNYGTSCRANTFRET